MASFHGFHFEQIGKQTIRHELKYLDREKEHPIFMKARELYLSHKWSAAKREYQKLLAINSHNVYYHHSYACILSRLQRSGTDPTPTIKKAQIHSAIATQLDPTNIDIRLTNIKFLTELQQNDEIHRQFMIIFRQLFSIPDDYIPTESNAITINPITIANTLEYYSHYLSNLGEHKHASEYLQRAVNLRKKYHLQTALRVQQDLAHFYLRMENVPKALHHIKITERMQKKSVWEKFQSSRGNDDKPWQLCKGEIYLLIENYASAYDIIKSDLDTIKRDNAACSSLIVYTDLIKCCIELHKFTEADALNDELWHMCCKNPLILKLASNRNIGWEREFMLAYSWIKQGGKNNAMKAVKQMKGTTKCVLEHNETNMGDRIPHAHFYLGLAYKNLSHYTQKRQHMAAAKQALYQAANLYHVQSIFLWQFAVVLCEDKLKELYLCIKYAKKAWKQCKEIECIATGFPKMQKKWKKRRNALKCGYCGEHKYLMSRKRMDKLKVCKGCHVVYYCNIKCQKRHWKQAHSKQCGKIWIKWKKKLLQTIDGFSPYIPVRQLKSDYCLAKALI